MVSKQKMLSKLELPSKAMSQVLALSLIKKNLNIKMRLLMMFTTMAARTVTNNLLHVLKVNKSQKEEEDEVANLVQEDAEVGGRHEGKYFYVKFLILDLLLACYDGD